MRASIRSTTRAALARIVLGTTAAAVVAAPAAPAFAQKKIDKKKQAKEYVDAGLAAQAGGDYDGAVIFYQKAYDLVPHPVLHFNIGQAHRLAGRDEEALAAYQAYLEAEPGGVKAKEARGFVKEIEARLAVKRKQEAEEAARRAAEEEARRKQEEEARKALPPDPEPEPEPEPEPDPEPRRDGGGGWMRPTGIAVGAAGVVSLGIGAFFGLKAKSLSDELSEPGAQFDPGKEADGEAAERNMFITVGAGAVLVAGGVVLFVLGGGDSGEREAQVGWTPVVGDGYQGVAYGGTF